MLSNVLDLHGLGVHVGHVHAGLALPRLPGISFADLRALLPGALIVFILGCVETISIVRSFRGGHGHEHENSQETCANQELTALGAANIGAGLMQGFVVDANLSVSADNEEAGARTPPSSLIAAGLIVLTALFATPLVHNLPEATLAATVIHAVLGLMDVAELRRYYAVRLLDLWVALVALVGMLVLGVVLGFLTSVMLSVLALLFSASRPRFSALGRAPGEDAYGDVGRHPGYEPVPGLLIVRPNSYLFFANARLLYDEVRRLVATSEPRPDAVLLDQGASDELDITSAEALGELVDELEAQGIEMRLAGVPISALELLRRDGLVERIGETRIHHTVPQGVSAFQGR